MPPLRWFHRSGPLLVIAAAWGVSLALPAISLENGPTLDGFDLLLRGWQGVPRGILAWLANPLFAAALVAALMRRPRVSAVLSAVALALGATSLLTEDLLRRQMTSVPDVAFRSGFFVWILALLALCVRSSALVHRARRAGRGSR